MKKIITLILLLSPFALMAQSLKVKAPSKVSVGENFRLTYTIGSQDVRDFRIGTIPDAFEKITGPYSSSQSSFVMANGKTQSSSSTTYTFILCALKEGKFSIPPAHITVDGKKVSSGSATITVADVAPSTNGAPRMHDDNDNHGLKSKGTHIGSSDLFIKVSANKKKVYEQEPILLSYKVYTLVDLTSLEGKMPDLTGFHTQEINPNQQKTFHVERVNGKAYKCVTWSQYVMYPQITGTLEIPSITFKGNVIQQNNDVDPFEALFNGGSNYMEVKKSIKAPGVTVQVEPLPKRPANFSGGVGSFNISAQIDKNEVKTNEPITVRVVVGGNGNMKLIKKPQLSFPKDFECYDPKITDKTQLTEHGIEGNMIYDFIVVPRNSGNFNIQPAEFTYYDLNENKYKTIKSAALNIKVTKGKTTSTVNSYSNIENKDIKPIKAGDINGINPSELFYASSKYWFTIGLLFILFIALLIAFRKRAINNADIIGMRIKKANKVAMKRLKKAEQMMRENKSELFYDEILKAMLGYAGDKLNIPTEKLSRENIVAELKECNVNEELSGRFIETLNICEYERYAPGNNTADNMSKIYDMANGVIIEIENTVKKKRTGKRIGFYIFCLFLLIPMTISAGTKDDADKDFAAGNYQQAIKSYESLLKSGKNTSDIWYNLGNAYYRSDNIPKAIICYERAHIYSPDDNDILFNLELARSKTIDKIQPGSEMFFFKLYRSIRNMFNVNELAILAIISIAISLIMTLVYLFSSRVSLRKVGFFCGIAGLILFIMFNLFAYQQYTNIKDSGSAIIMSNSAAIKETPTINSKDLFILHEGTKVYIIDETMKEWRNIRLDDGRTGWIQCKDIEKI